MFTTQQYRAKAAEYTNLAKAAQTPAELLEFEFYEKAAARPSQDEA